jgi:hypothetical protein
LLPEGAKAAPKQAVQVGSEQLHSKALTKIYAAGICCPSEVPLITNILARLPGIIKVQSSCRP